MSEQHAPASARVTQLFVYPLKSCRPVRVDTLSFDAHGPLHDRRWMLVNERGTFFSARADGRLLLVEVGLAGEGADPALELAAPGRPPIRVDPRDVEGRIPVRVWDDALAGELHAAGSAYFSEWLGRSVSLVHFPADAHRAVEERYAGPGHATAFSDGYPLLLTNEASLEDLNARLAAKGEATVPMARFRPNVVVSGLGAWEEDRLDTFSLGELRLRNPKPCARCVVTTIDPESAARSPEPLRTLGEFRTVEGKVLFGVNLIQLGGEVLRVGDALHAS